MGSVSFRENHQLQLFMKDSKRNSSFVVTSKMGFNNEPFFLNTAVSLCKVHNSCSQASQVIGFRFYLSCSKSEVMLYSWNKTLCNKH